MVTLVGAQLAMVLPSFSLAFVYGYDYKCTVSNDVAKPLLAKASSKNKC